MYPKNQLEEKGKIYFDENKRVSKLQSHIEINKNLGLSGKVSKLLHKLGIPSIYLFEALLKHPYKKKIWVGKYVRTFVYTATILSFVKLIKMPNRIKVNINKDQFCRIIYKEIKKYKLSFLLIVFFVVILAILAAGINTVRKFINFFEKRIRNLVCSNKPVILVSKNREKFSNLKKINQFL